MSEPIDLEKLKQDVENLKKYLTTFTRSSYLIYDELNADYIDWENSKQILNRKYALLDFVADDLFNNNNINEYYDKYIERDNEEQLLDTMHENKRRKNIKRGGKTRKNRKPKK